MLLNALYFFTTTGSNLNQLALESFLKEGVIMNNFTHPHVLNLLGVCIDNKNPMVILPYMAGGDLRSFIKDKKKVDFHLLSTLLCCT